MKELKPRDFSKAVQNVFHLLSIQGEYRIIGSAKLATTKYVNDYDIQEHVQEPAGKQYPTALLHIFQQKFRQAEENPTLFILDFKCGEYNGEPIRWNKSTIKRGKQTIGGHVFSFQKCVLMKSTIKMDVVAFLNGTFVEFTENYYFKIGKHTNYKKKSKTTILQSLSQEAKELANQQKMFKALKRVFSFLRLKQSQPQVQKQLIDFFNGQVGLLNKCKHDVEILDNLLGNSFRKPNRTDIISNLHIIKESLEQINDLELRQNMRQTIDLIVRRRGLNEMKSGMDILKSYLQKKVHEETLAYLDGNKILQKYIR
jgi:Trp operon repressor